MTPDIVASCEWSPVLIIELLKALAWPTTVLLLGAVAVATSNDRLRAFFSNRSLKEISAGTGGISATFETDKQVPQSVETGSARAVALPESMSLETIKRKHTEYETELSKELYANIKKHIADLGVSDQEAIDLLTKDNALLQCGIRFYEINDIIFRSQYNLLSETMASGQPITLDSIKEYFKTVQKKYGGLTGWDHIKYIAFLLEARLISEANGNYQISPLGTSYLKFMRKNLQLVEALAKL